MWDPGWTQRESWRPERMDDVLGLRMDRHRAFIRDGGPAPYRNPQNIAEGGAPFGTRMPAFKDALGEEQIWQIVTCMRAGFPPADAP